MANALILQFNKLARTGLRDHEGVLEHRDVILINRLITAAIVVMIVYIPLELFLNGVAMIHLVLLLIAMMVLTLYFNSRRWFRLSRIYTYVLGMLFVPSAGLLAGKEVNNIVTIIPLMLIAIVFFRSLKERIGALSFTIAVYFITQAAYSHVTPVMLLPAETAALFRHVFFVLALLLVFLIGHYLTWTNSQYEAVISMQRAELEEKNREVMDSITYARRIQSAIMPAREAVRARFPQSFIYYSPKDIVAGDFYWMEHAGDWTLIAVADCTGHGVPGALVSVVCNNALNRCVREHGLSDPGDILDKARQIITSEFSRSEMDIKDGMDISLCAVHAENRTLRWAGANNPLLIFRAGKLYEIKADRQPVGNHVDPKPFTTHTHELASGDAVYLFSDGFADQFGEKTGKKFRMKQFKEKLELIAPLDMESQHRELSSTLSAWKGSLEQVDDICVIGLKMAF